jgi:hypothetical protein
MTKIFGFLGREFHPPAGLFLRLNEGAGSFSLFPLPSVQKNPLRRETKGAKRGIERYLEWEAFITGIPAFPVFSSSVSST